MLASLNKSSSVIAPLLLLSIFAEFAVAMEAPVEFPFHHEDVLGTSLDLIVCARDAGEAKRVEGTVLAEIERLRRILSTRDTTSEISRLNRARGPIPCSVELLQVLGAYERWNSRSSGAYSGQLGELIAAWRSAERTGMAPEKTFLARLVRDLAQPGWEIDASAQTVTRHSEAPLNVDSLGKGYIIDKALAAASGQSAGTLGLLLNIGGDIHAWGISAEPGGLWRIGVAAPSRPEDNAPPLTRMLLADRAVSTSGAYERGYQIAGEHYSHILDPRTGWPAAGAASATVVASDSATANALATTLCVLGPVEGLRLVRETPGTECLIVAANGSEFRSQGFAALEVPAPGESKAAQPSLWPKDFRVKLDFTLRFPQNAQKVKHPYVAVWIENAEGKPVRTVTFWANKPKYYQDMPVWWHIGRSDPVLVQAVTRATRAAGHHAIVWDGRDDAGNPLPPGVYTVNLEVAREHGGHAHRGAQITCGQEPAKAALADGNEFEKAQITYGPGGN